MKRKWDLKAWARVSHVNLSCYAPLLVGTRDLVRDIYINYFYLRVHGKDN